MEQNEISKRLDAVACGDAELITELLAIEHELPYGSQEFISPVVNFLNVTRVDIFAECANSLREGKDAFRIAELLVALFGDLQTLNIFSLQEFLQEYFHKTKNDFGVGRFYEPIKARSKNDANWGLEFAQEILNRKDERLYVFLMAAYLGVAQSDFTQGYDKLIQLIKSDEPYLQQNGLKALGQFAAVPDSQKKEELTEILLRYSADENENIAANAAFSLCRFASTSKLLEDKKIELSVTGKPAVRYEIVTHIWITISDTKKISAADLTAIKNICNYDLQHRGITEKLDSLVYLLLTYDRVNEVEQILNEWIVNHPIRVHLDSSFVELFDATVFQITKNQTFVTRVITKWLNSDDSRFHHVLSEVVSYMASLEMKKIELDLNLLSGFSYDDHLFIIRKIVGYILDFDISISLILSILRLAKFEKDVGDLVGSVLVEHIGYNYTHRTIKRLELEIESSSDRSEEILKLCIGELEQRGNELKSLNRSSEILPNSDHAIRLNKAFRKAMSNSMEESKAKSSFLSLVSQVSIKEGLSWFSFHHGQYHEPSKMGRFSHDLELPRKDVVDEIGALMERVGFRQAERGEV